MTSVSALMSPIVSKPARRSGQARLSEGDYTDDRGCEVNPVVLGCLSCPLPVCKYDLPLIERDRRIRQGRLNRDRVVELARQGLSVAGIAAATGLNQRTVYRYLQLAAVA